MNDPFSHVVLSGNRTCLTGIAISGEIYRIHGEIYGIHGEIYDIHDVVLALRIAVSTIRHRSPSRHVG